VGSSVPALGGLHEAAPRANACGLVGLHVAVHVGLHVAVHVGLHVAAPRGAAAAERGSAGQRPHVPS